MEAGNRYSAAIVSSSDRRVTIIIREVYQHPSQVGRLSFPARGLVNIQSDVGDRAIRRELEYEESLLGEPGYTVVGGDEPELLPEESHESNGESNEEE